MSLTDAEVKQIASRTADEVMERIRKPMDIRDVILGGAMGEGAIPLYGRETRKAPCSCCLIDPSGPNEPENRMCTTEGAIGILKDSEERDWCSEIEIVSDGRCERARTIREAAKVCKAKYPEDTAKFFQCYAPAFSKITKGSNPGISKGETWEEFMALPRANLMDIPPGSIVAYSPTGPRWRVKGKIDGDYIIVQPYTGFEARLAGDAMTTIIERARS